MILSEHSELLSCYIHNKLSHFYPIMSKIWIGSVYNVKYLRYQITNLLMATQQTCVSLSTIGSINFVLVRDNAEHKHILI